MTANSSDPSPPDPAGSLDVSVRERALSDMKIRKIYDYWLKKSDGGEDEHRQLSDQIQKITDEIIAEIDELVAAKEAEIKQMQDWLAAHPVK